MSTEPGIYINCRGGDLFELMPANEPGAPGFFTWTTALALMLKTVSHQFAATGRCDMVACQVVRQ